MTWMYIASGYMTFGMKPITGRMNTGALTSITGRSWVRYREGFECKWNDRPQHCGRFAENVFELPHKLSDIRLKHLGWGQKRRSDGEIQKISGIRP
ncbi:hypothetical protein CHI08_22345 [Peribacillus simplex]|nr:hypothetical protein CHI08_22345 [Peribacillus simplex]